MHVGAACGFFSSMTASRPAMENDFVVYEIPGSAARPSWAYASDLFCCLGPSVCLKNTNGTPGCSLFRILTDSGCRGHQCGRSQSQRKTQRSSSTRLLFEVQQSTNSRTAASLQLSAQLARASYDQPSGVLFQSRHTTPPSTMSLLMPGNGPASGPTVWVLALWGPQVRGAVELAMALALSLAIVFAVLADHE